MWVILYVLAVTNDNEPPYAEAEVVPYFEGLAWETREACEEELLTAYLKPLMFNGFLLKKNGQINLISEGTSTFEKVSCIQVAK